MGISKNGWFVRENAVKWMIWGYPYFRKPPYTYLLYVYTFVYLFSRALGDRDLLATLDEGFI